MRETTSGSLRERAYMEAGFPLPESYAHRKSAAAHAIFLRRARLRPRMANPKFPCYGKCIRGDVHAM
jgi:hypothetical protein